MKTNTTIHGSGPGDNARVTEAAMALGRAMGTALLALGHERYRRAQASAMEALAQEPGAFGPDGCLTPDGARRLATRLHREVQA